MFRVKIYTRPGSFSSFGFMVLALALGHGLSVHFSFSFSFSLGLFVTALFTVFFVLVDHCALYDWFGGEYILSYLIIWLWVVFNIAYPTMYSVCS